MDLGEWKEMCQEEYGTVNFLPFAEPNGCICMYAVVGSAMVAWHRDSTNHHGYC